MSQQRKHVRERRMEWRECVSVKEGQEETESGLEHETERMAGGNQRQQDSQGCIRCCVSMEKGCYRRGESGSSGAGYITDPMAAHIHTPQPACHHQPAQTTQPQQQLHQRLPACLHAASSVVLHIHSMFASFLTSQLSVLRASALSLVSSKSL